jgi:SNF2 family DNA or RNA helicase
MLTAINDLKYNRFLIRKALIIAPKKVAEATWQLEAKKWDHLKLLRIVTVLGTKQQRIRALNTPGDVYVINRDNVQFLVDYYRNAWPFDMVVVDESSSFKNHEAKRFKALTWVRPHMKRIVNLTGTPAPNSLMDIWAQIYLLDQGERLGKRFHGFRARYFEQNAYSMRYTMKKGAEDAIMNKISDICVSMKAEDYIELPDCVDVDHPVKLDAKAQKAYDKMERDMLLEVEEDIIDAGSAAVLTGKLLQLCNGAVYCADETGGRKVIKIHDCKIEAFLELVERLNGKPALVFYAFQHDLDRIMGALDGSGLRVVKLSGAAEQQAWNNREIDILLAHPASCAYGLN